MKKLLLSIVFALACNTIIFSQCNPKSVKIRAGTASPLCDSTKLDWANWNTINNTTASGTIANNLTVSVTKPSGSLFSTTAMYSGSFFPTSYNVPVNQTSIANNVAGVFTFCFSNPVSDPVVALASIGRQGVSVPINTSLPYQVVWQGISMQYPSCTQLIGEEGYTIIKFPGVHSCISFDYLVSENWCNIAFGTMDINCQTSGPKTYCSGSNGSNVLTAYATGGTAPYTYNWSPSSGLNNTSGVSVIASPQVTTKYFVSVTDASNTFIGMDSITLNVIPLPTVSINSAAICEGESATLTATPTVNGGTYHWSPVISSTNSITESPTSTTIYTVVYTLNGCSATASGTIKINPPPDVFITAQTQGITTLLTASASISGGSYVWNPTGETTSNISVIPQTATTYTVTYNLNGCINNAEITVHPDFTLYIPNAFTPNGDGLNDIFKAKGTEILEFNMEIFNRWGDLIYSNSDMKKGWDGTAFYSNFLAQTDVYVYKINVKDNNNKTHNYIGHVSLIK